MSEPSFDRRVTPWRSDLAAAHLAGTLTAPRYAEGRRMRVTAPRAGLRRAPRGDEGLDTELLFGERFTLYDAHEGWAWGQSAADSYVGYVPEEALSEDDGAHEDALVDAVKTLVFPAPDFKLTPLFALTLGARLRLAERGPRFTRLKSGGFIPSAQIAPLNARAADAASVALRFLGAPYLWGGRSADGIDCSGLVQLALMRIGVEAPRDSDMQEEALGRTIGTDPAALSLQRGDLVFFDGHVGIMTDAAMLLHASAYQMAVVLEPLGDVRTRLAAEGLALRQIKRL